MAIYTEAELNILIANAKAAIASALLGKSYWIDTGQSVQRVTRQDLPHLREYLNELEGRLDELTGVGGLQYINQQGY